jgi:hypothetical protein
MPLHGDPRVRELLDTYPEQLTARHASLIVERLKDPEFAARYPQILGDASQIVNERIAKPVLWALGKKDGIENWKKVLDGKMSGFMKGSRRVQVPDPALSLSQDAGVKPGKTPARRFDSDRMHLEAKARQYCLPERFPQVWEEWRRRFRLWCADKDNPNFNDLRWLEAQIEPLVAEQQVRKHMPASLRDERYRRWGEAELMAEFGEVLGRTEVV